jgi:hypothetical protein
MGYFSVCDVHKWCLATSMLRMVYKGNSDWYHASKVHSIYLSINLIVVTLTKFKSIHMCTIEQTHGSTYVGGANTIKIENMISFHIFVMVVINYQKGRD